ncbi:MAG: Gfo/Idh/MocA family oxidoreductase [Acidobacteria bacterium]|nr:Gfo/Idh/MocA family oxidoreductase [Acidobacteriota bacterium]
MRIAVAGLGFMGSTHLQALRNVEGAVLHAVVSDSPIKLSGDLSAIKGNLDRPGQKLDFSSVRKYRTLAEALADPEVEAVDLCLPTYLHESAAIEALRAGKHVLVEKPMALDGDACNRMIEAAREAGKILMTAQVLRFWKDYQPLVEAAHGKSQGAARSVLFRRRCAAPAWGKWLHDASKGGGGVFDLLIHDVDMCVHLFGIPEAVSATGSEDLEAGVDVITAQLHYKEIPSVVVSGGWHHPSAYPFSMEYTASFDLGTLEFSTLGRPVTLYSHTGEAKPLEPQGRDGFEAELAYFIECASANLQPELCPPAESAAAVRLTNRMVEARRHNGAKLACDF